MLGFAGLAILFVMVFGGYLLAGGSMGIILKSLPFEMIMIGGAALGAFLVSNDTHTVKHTIKDIKMVFKGPKWNHKDYQDLLGLLHELIRTARDNPVSLETHIDNPEESSIFLKTSKILRDPEAVSLICDTLRAANLNYDDPHQVEEILDKRMDIAFQSSLHTSHALQGMADALPALGIVAAVLGVIKTMGAIDQPPEVLGKMIGGALVGTFLGVFLAYGIVGPFATKVKSISEEERHFLQVIREVLVANLHNHSARNCIEVGRQSLPKHLRPSYDDICSSP